MEAKHTHTRVNLYCKQDEDDEMNKKNKLILFIHQGVMELKKNLHPLIQVYIILGTLNKLKLTSN